MSNEGAFIASVVIPAHNEELVIGRLLSGLSELIASGTVDVVVACNGCTDATAEIARGLGARVVETATPSKVAALNAGDQAAHAYPRLYIDADVVVSARAVLDVIGSLSHGNCLCAAPPVRVQVDGCPIIVRAYFSIWSREPYLSSSYVGSGFYALSQAGRSRFASFPQVIADDKYVRDLFTRRERTTVNTEPFVIQAPRSTRSLYRRRVRISRGNLEIAMHPSLSRLPGSRERVRAWWTVLRRPLLLPGAVVYAVINAAAKVEALWQTFTRRRAVWSKDETSRV